jgi:hypothetical protein
LHLAINEIKGDGIISNKNFKVTLREFHVKFRDKKKENEKKSIVVPDLDHSFIEDDSEDSYRSEYYQNESNFEEVEAEDN